MAVNRVSPRPPVTTTRCPAPSSSSTAAAWCSGGHARDGGGGPGVDHDVRLLPHQGAHIGIVLDPELAVISRGQPEARCLRDAQGPLRFRLVFGKILAGPQPHVQQAAGIVRGGSGDAVHAGQPQQQGQRQRGLMERRQDDGLVDPRVPDERRSESPTWPLSRLGAGFTIHGQRQL